MLVSHEPGELDALDLIEGEFLLLSEETHRRADLLAYWDSNAVADGAENYIKKIKTVTKKEVVSAGKKFFTKNYALAVIE